MIVCCVRAALSPAKLFCIAIRNHTLYRVRRISSALKETSQTLSRLIKHYGNVTFAQNRFNHLGPCAHAFACLGHRLGTDLLRVA